MPLSFTRDDITKLNVDAIVNSANTALRMGSGVCGAIFAAAGAVRLQKVCNELAPIEIGKAVITDGFDLPAKHIIHAVGPIYHDGEQGEEALLRSCYLNALELAVKNGCKSIAFPLISSGVYGYPKSEALRVATAAIRDFIAGYEIDVWLVIFDKDLLVPDEDPPEVDGSHTGEHAQKADSKKQRRRRFFLAPKPDDNSRFLLTAEEMRTCEEWAIREWGISSLVLQEHAALGALALIPEGEHIHVLAGPGNNGGDALALARLAKLQGRTVDVWTLTEAQNVPPRKGHAAIQARLWEGLGGEYQYTDNPLDKILAWHGWVVDGLFGLGVRLPFDNSPLGINVRRWIEVLENPEIAKMRFNVERRFKVLALDLPTGLDPSSGDIPGPVIRADKTACFGYLKRCHGLMPAKDLCGDITVIPIPLDSEPDSSLSILSEPRISKPHWNTNKYKQGHVAIRAGTKGMSGAAVLAATGALRGGAGLVTILPEPDVADLIASQIPEAMVKPWEGVLPDKIDVLLVGPGGVEEIPEWHGPLVLDASALKEGEGLKWMKRGDTIITPHAGEFSRLFGEEAGSNTQECLKAIEKLFGRKDGVWRMDEATLVMKGAQTLIRCGWSGHVYVNPTGHPGLATGGTGDFLAGLIAARFALRWNSRETRYTDDPMGDDISNCFSASEAALRAATEAVWLHGAAADRLGKGPLLVRELGESLAQLLREMYSA